ncbi:MAG: hypothetical protein HY301_16285 [Verrucomicrobia bacterium]|nr:hypothetical protein [Verrucomicrobiota bacterium]
MVTNIKSNFSLLKGVAATALISVALFIPGAAFADGALFFENLNVSTGNGGVMDVPVFDVDNTTKLIGTNYSVELSYGAIGTPDDQLIPLPATISSFNTNPIFAGYFNHSTIQLPGISVGSQARLQVFAWDNQGGTLISYDSASVRGASLSFDSLPLADLFGPPSSIPFLQGMQSFHLAQSVPEPATGCLALVGAVVFLFHTRKRGRSGKRVSGR